MISSCALASANTAAADESPRIHSTCSADDAARRPDGVDDQRPLIAGARHQRDPVARPDARADEPPGQGGHLLAELGSRHVLPVAGARSACAA